ncbi:MAG TPA: hypothetical protein PKJ95_04330 [Atribacterota bacterium]|nr:hypothetical protein [Atribacterota bacterium]
MYKELLQAYTDEYDRKKKEGEEIEELKRKALEAGVEINNHIFTDNLLWNVRHSTIKHMIEDEIEFRNKLREKALKEKEAEQCKQAIKNPEEATEL